jgi:TolA-binding protein
VKLEINPWVIIISILLLVSVAANGYFYFSANNSLQKEVVNLQSQVISLESQTASLQSQVQNLQNNSGADNQTIANLNGQIINLRTQNENLQKEKDNLTALIQSLQNQSSTQNQSSAEDRMAYLVTRLGTKIHDTVPIGGPTSQQVLVISGEVENDGNGTAYNCQIKVVTYELNNSDPFTDYFQLGSGNLTVGSSVNFFANVIHGDIVNWQIFPECTNTP